MKILLFSPFSFSFSLFRNTLLFLIPKALLSFQQKGQFKRLLQGVTVTEMLMWQCTDDSFPMTAIHTMYLTYWIYMENIVYIIVLLSALKKYSLKPQSNTQYYNNQHRSIILCFQIQMLSLWKKKSLAFKYNKKITPKDMTWNLKKNQRD